MDWIGATNWRFVINASTFLGVRNERLLGPPGDAMTGSVHQISVSTGGVPKLPVEFADVVADGLVGDTQKNRKHHGGPTRAVCVYGLDAIEALRAEGHPIGPGTTGENLTLAGLVWADIGVGSRFVFEGGLELEVLSFAEPCYKIRASFAGGNEDIVNQRTSPGLSRVYTRVVTPGRCRVGEGVTVS